MKLTPLENWIIEKSRIGERSRAALEEYQLSQVRQTLNYAKLNSRFYGERIKDIDAEKIRTLEDVRSIPFTLPQEIQEDPFAFLCVPQSEISRVVSLCSTGTSGTQKRIFFAEEDLAQTIDFFVYGMSGLVDETDAVLVLLPGDSYGSIGDLLKKALDRLNVTCVVHGLIADTEETANEIIKNDITCVVGIPTQVLELSRTKSEVFKSRIKSVLLSADYVPEVLIRELTEKCDCRVFTHYGMTEMGYGGGVECEALNGYHMREADLLFEIIDPETGRAVPDGEYGELVFTTLTRRAMPLIRYRTGDIAAFSPNPCACGTFLKTMKQVKGRLNNRIEICESGFLYMAELDEIVLSFCEVLDYSAGLMTDDCLDVEVVAESVEAFFEIKDELAKRVQNYANEKFGQVIGVKVRLSPRKTPERRSNSMIKRTIGDYRTAEGTADSRSTINVACE